MVNCSRNMDYVDPEGSLSLPLRRRNAEVRLVCFPFAGAGTLALESWAQELPVEIELVLVRLPGRESRLPEAPYTTMRQVLTGLQRSLGSLVASDAVPFAFFGHCMGAVVAFEFARYMRAHNWRMPRHLIVSGARAPQLKVHSADDELIHKFSEPDFMERLRLLGGVPSIILDNPQFARVFTRALRADFSIAETYTYSHESALECGISAFAGIYDPDVAVSDLSAWQDQTSGDFDYKVFEGDHFYFREALTRHKMQAAIARTLLRHPARLRPPRKNGDCDPQSKGMNVNLPNSEF